MKWATEQNPVKTAKGKVQSYIPLRLNVLVLDQTKMMAYCLHPEELKNI